MEPQGQSGEDYMLMIKPPLRGAANSSMTAIENHDTQNNTCKLL